MEACMEHALDDTVRALKTYMHNQIAQATLVLSGTSLNDAAPLGGAPGTHTAVNEAGARRSPQLPSSIDLGL
jgi:hypothetical protein